MALEFPKVLTSEKLLIVKPLSDGFKATVNPDVDGLLTVTVSLIAVVGRVVVGGTVVAGGVVVVGGAVDVGGVVVDVEVLERLALIDPILEMIE